jgi:hypothetical protein
MIFSLNLVVSFQFPISFISFWSMIFSYKILTIKIYDFLIVHCTPSVQFLLLISFNGDFVILTAVEKSNPTYKSDQKRAERNN